MIITFPTLPQNKNYNFIGISGEDVFVVDPSVFEDVEAQLQKFAKPLTYILITHHHWDHVGGIDALMEKYACKLIVPTNFPLQKNNVFRQVGEGDVVSIGEFSFRVLEAPGHTKDHIIYHDDVNQVAFVGDVLFRMGCGRNFEGTFDEFTRSLWKVYQLPDRTQIHCAHEYTAHNLEFALSIDPKNSKLLSLQQKVTRMLAAGEYTVPFELSQDKQENPFLTVFKGLSSVSTSTVEMIKRLRMQKDSF